MCKEFNKMYQLSKDEQVKNFARLEETRELFKAGTYYDKWAAIEQILAVRHTSKNIYQFVDLIGLYSWEL